MVNEGYVYLLGDSLNEGIYKIGVTRGNVENRIKKLQTGNPGNIYIFSKHKTKYPFYIEKVLHFKYYNQNVLNEWFKLDLEDALNFEKNCIFEESVIKSMEDNPFLKKMLK